MITKSEAKLFRYAQPLCAVGGLGDNLKFAGVLDDGPNTVVDQLVVVNENDPVAHLCPRARSFVPIT